MTARGRKRSGEEQAGGRSSVMRANPVKPGSSSLTHDIVCRGMMENKGIGIAIISPQMEVLDMNLLMREWFPGAIETHQPRCHRIFNDPPREEPCLKCPVRKTLNDGEAHQSVTRALHGGKMRHYRITSSPLRDTEDRIIGAIEMVDDITGLVENQEELRRHHDRLAELIKERTRALTRLDEQLAVEILGKKEADEVLKKTLQELERSNKDLQSFAYAASHDLQEPLRTIASYVQLLERRYTDRLDEDGKDFIAFIVDATARMKRLINDLLEFSRVERKGKPPARTDCDAVLRYALANLKPVIEDTGACIISAPLPEILADEGQLVIVFQNLLANAIKFRGERKPEISIAATRDAGTWTFSISDNGIGIDPKYFGRIFEIFQRLHSQGEYPGTGIGLAMVKKIIERHGGAVGLESEPGNGSMFYFTIPDKGENQ